MALHFRHPPNWSRRAASFASGHPFVSSNDEPVILLRILCTVTRHPREGDDMQGRLGGKPRGETILITLRTLGRLHAA